MREPALAIQFLDHAFAQMLVFTGEQFLRQIVSALVDVKTCSGKMLVDPNSGRAAEVIGQGQELIRVAAVIHFRLREGTGGADREQLGRDADKTRKEQL